jgi:hypothetical protein
LTDETAIGEADTAALAALRAKAIAKHHGDTQPLLVVYSVESFLRRLEHSAYADRMVLMGGMLMAAKNVRRMARDAHLSTPGLADGVENVRAAVIEICALAPTPPDGVTFDPATIRTDLMREADEYHGVGCRLVANVGKAAVSVRSQRLPTTGVATG